MKKGAGRTILIVVIILIILIIIGYQLGWFGNKKLFSNGGRISGPPSSGFTPGSGTSGGSGIGSSTVIVGTSTPTYVGYLDPNIVFYDSRGNIISGSAKAKACCVECLTPYLDANGNQQYAGGVKLYVCNKNCNCATF